MSVCVIALFVVFVILLFPLKVLEKKIDSVLKREKSQHGNETVYVDCSPFVCGTCEWDSKCPNVFLFVFFPSRMLWDEIYCDLQTEEDHP